ncbi:helix-turn-helix domain-containing protein [Pseudoroseomonas cervicalis]|uniref:helix-turn-helix domain-containing protein n=1 Tax=Teichococcus cervicalis TaxID=204525 RepID=UPI0022F192D8|nr:AraC family transcriptional regulator [Pseudoroseomonas cervicalis]WBV41565.1 AraC family transcriptional regulator [Pseudoroseomonas cervicalis]
MPQILKDSPATLAPWQAVKVLRHIEAHLAEALSVAQLAALVGLSAGYFSRAFRASQSLSPHAFILQRRLARAQLLMLASSRGLSDIALECGFCDQPHLTRRFRHALGMSPAAWRRGQRQVRALPVRRDHAEELAQGAAG